MGGAERNLALRALAAGPAPLPTHVDHGGTHRLRPSAVLLIAIPSSNLIPTPHAWEVDRTPVSPVTRGSETVGLVLGHTAHRWAQTPPPCSLLSPL